jgi:hypothetical protein
MRYQLTAPTHSHSVFFRIHASLDLCAVKRLEAADAQPDTNCAQKKIPANYHAKEKRFHVKNFHVQEIASAIRKPTPAVAQLELFLAPTARVATNWHRPQDVLEVPMEFAKLAKDAAAAIATCRPPIAEIVISIFSFNS